MPKNVAQLTGMIVTTIVVFAMVGLTMTFFFAVDWLLAMGERWLIGAMS